MPPTEFDPAAHPPLTELGTRLPELAGAAAYRAGRDYLRKGNVHDGTVAETSAYATVKGSTEYRVTVAFPGVESTKVTCTCPAHRRNKFCKHVVAVCTALVEQPAAFAVMDALPAPPAPARVPHKRKPASPKANPAEMRAAGLSVLDRLLTELADGGIVQLGPEKAALIEQCAELVRALKLRRLGNLLMQLQRAVANPRVLAAAEARQGAAFARLLLDLYLCRAATVAQLEGTVSLDPRLAEDLLGKTWRADDLEPINDLEMIQVASTHENDGEFVVETSYLADLASQEIYTERQITPARLASANPKTQHRVRLLVEEAGLYPGLPPRRIRLGQVRRAPLRQVDLDRVIVSAVTDLTEIQRRLVERASVPFGQPDVAVLFAPSMLITPRDRQSGPGAKLGVVDAAGRFARLEWEHVTIEDLEASLPADRPVVLTVLARIDDNGLVLRGLNLIGATLRRASRRYGLDPAGLPV